MDTHLSQDEYLFLGNILVFSPGNYTNIKVVENKLLFPQALLFRKDDELTEWYKKYARTFITDQVDRFRKEINTSINGLTFSDTKSQWGRCTHNNRLQFNWRLIMAPILVINYVVIHELAHTIEKNHTRAFWAIVRKYNPSYRQQIIWLKKHGTKLQLV